MDDNLFPNAAVFGLPISGEDIEQTDFGPSLEHMLQSGTLDWSDLPREQDLGYVEYKWKLREHVNAKRIEGLATQMSFRLQEGEGKAYYLVGVSDSGRAEGLSPKDHNLSVEVLMQVAHASRSVFLLESINKERRNRRCSVWRVIRSDSKEVRSRLDALHIFLPEQPRIKSIKSEVKPDHVRCRVSSQESASSATTHSPRTSLASLSTAESTPLLSSGTDPQLELAMIAELPTPIHASTKMTRKTRKERQRERATAPAIVMQDQSVAEQTMLSPESRSAPDQDQKLSLNSNLQSGYLLDPEIVSGG